MASDEIYEFTVTTPAGTPQGNPRVTATVFDPRIVDRIEWRVPAGSLGVMGWRISMRGVQVIPANGGGWIVAHETAGGWDLANHPDSGDWSVTTYNTGAFPHSLAVIFHVRLIPKVVPELVLAGAAELYGEPAADWTGY